MKAGRELDALIAEKVMGLPVKDYRGTGRQPALSWAGEYVGIGWAANDEPYIVRDDKGWAGCPHVALIPHYSSNIAAAWEVVERLVSTPGPNGDHHSVQVDYSGGAVVVIDENEDWQVSAIAGTVPLAICLAALKAVSQEGQG